jgi:hypothetical protein
MTANEEPSGFYEQLPPDVSGLVAKAFEAMDASSSPGTTYREVFSFQENPYPARSNYWIRWEYAPDEWELFDRLDWGKALGASSW